MSSKKKKTAKNLLFDKTSNCKIKFIASRKPPTKILIKNKIPSIIKRPRNHKKIILQSIKTIWKRYYINQFKFNTKFKAINRYFGHLFKRRDQNGFLHQETKRSRNQYWKQKVFGRNRDRLKAKHAQLAKRRNVFKTKRHKNESKSKYIINQHMTDTSDMSKIKIITIDSDKTNIFQSKNKAHLTKEKKHLLEDYFHCFRLPRTVHLPVDNTGLVSRYRNQHVFIYKPSIRTKRPPKQNLIGIFSTLNGYEIKSNHQTKHNRISSISQPTPSTQHNIKSSRKIKPKTELKPVLKNSSADTGGRYPNSHRVKVKSKQQ